MLVEVEATGDHPFGEGTRENAAGVGHGYRAGDEFREKRVLQAGRERVNPRQFAAL
jgi:hypothetical protein